MPKSIATSAIVLGFGDVVERGSHIVLREEDDGRIRR